VYARSSAGNTFSYVLSDHQGSNSDLTNSSGTSIVNESFTPFGQRRNPTTWSGAASNSDLTTAAGITRQGYTFQTQLGLWMGMNHMNGRVEDAITGRMLSADPHVPDRTNPQSYNRYTYVNNNPLTATDPSGFCSPAWACKQDAGSGLGKCRVCGGSDPGSLLGDSPAMGSPQGISGFDVTLCDGCSTGSNISNGLTDAQETAMLATGATATATFAGGGDVTLTMSNGDVAVLNPDGTVQTAYNSSTGAGLVADLNLETVTVNANRQSTADNIISQVETQITQAVNTAQAQMQTSLIALGAHMEALGLGAESSAEAVGPAVAKIAGGIAALGATAYDYANGASRYIVAGDVAVGVAATALAFPEDVLLGVGWLETKSLPAYTQTMGTLCASGNPIACGGSFTQ